MYIYKITNTVNNKFYIGQTVNFEARMRQHITRCDELKIDKAISRFGCNKFKFEILFECNQVDVDLLEMYLILETESYKDDIGYNVRFCYLSEDEIRSAKNLLDCIKSGKYVLDYTYVINIYKRVVCLDDNFEFNSISSCARYYNIIANHISDVCKGNRATTGGLQFRYLDDDGFIVEPEGSAKKKTTEVYVEETCTFYPSIKDACTDLGLDYRSSNSSIIKHLDGKTEHAYHYYFHYVENGEVVPSKYVSSREKRKVIVDNLHVFDSVAEAIKFYDLPSGARGAISQCCRGKSSNAYGHTWSYLDADDNPIVNEFIVKK